VCWPTDAAKTRSINSLAGEFFRSPSWISWRAMSLWQVGPQTSMQSRIAASSE
jgi:hypothetical protein